MVLDPVRTAGPEFFDRVEDLIAHLKASGAKRLPGDRRYSQRQRSLSEGISVSSEYYEMMMGFLV
jgi:delta1-piperideine-2-carboxylate reductase